MELLIFNLFVCFFKKIKVLYSDNALGEELQNELFPMAQ